MFRRFCATRNTVVVPGISMSRYSGTGRLLSAVDPVEKEREKELRQQVLQKYKGMQIPEMTTFEYGHFGTGGIQRAAAQQAMSGQGFSSFFSGGGSGGCSTGGCGAGGGNSGDGSAGSSNGNNGGNAFMGGGNTGGPVVPSVFRVDWLMLFTGVALMYVSGKILYNQMTRGVNDLDFPLWTASLESQAKHLIFCVQYDEKEREEMKREFQAIRQSNPFADFFQWVQSRHPEFCCGNRNSADMSVTALVSALSSTNSRELMALATTLRQSLSRRGGDPLNRVDDFMAKLLSNGAMLGAVGGMGGGFAGTGRSPAPLYSPPASNAASHMYSPPPVDGHPNGTNPFAHMETKEAGH